MPLTRRWEMIFEEQVWDLLGWHPLGLDPLETHPLQWEGEWQAGWQWNRQREQLSAWVVEGP